MKKAQPPPTVSLLLTLGAELHVYLAGRGLNCLQVSLDSPQFNSATVYIVAHITEFHWHLAPPNPSLEW